MKFIQNQSYKDFTGVKRHNLISRLTGTKTEIVVYFSATIERNSGYNPAVHMTDEVDNKLLSMKTGYLNDLQCIDIEYLSAHGCRGGVELQFCASIITNDIDSAVDLLVTKLESSPMLIGNFVVTTPDEDSPQIFGSAMRRPHQGLALFRDCKTTLSANGNFIPYTQGCYSKALWKYYRFAA